jgi:hypothetical protein
MSLLSCAPCTFLIGAAIAGSAGESQSVQSEAAACELLKEAAVRYCLSRTNLTGRYYCDPLPDDGPYYLMGLRYRVSPGELVGSNLAGWFAIRRSDGQVFEWDINDEVALPLTSGCPFERD